MILRKATFEELPLVWNILEQAIEQRRIDGSKQWQDGYPNEQIVINDINNEYAYVFVVNNEIVAYLAIIFGIEPAYNNINGKWLTDDKYVTVHRVAVANMAKGQGVATKIFKMIEGLSVAKLVFSIKVDTNFDNVQMLKILSKLGYVYCGEVSYRGSKRKAFEKVLFW